MPERVGREGAVVRHPALEFAPVAGLAHHVLVPGCARAGRVARQGVGHSRPSPFSSRVQAAAAEEGLVYDSSKMKRQPNTTDAHRLIFWASSIGKSAEMKQRLMDLYFTEGGDLTDREVLVKAAADIGLEAAKVREALASDADLAAVEAAADQAKDAGIDGVPFFIIGNLAAISGAQSPEVIANAIEQVALNRDKLEAQRAKQPA